MADDLTDEDVERIVETVLAEEMGIHPSDIDVEYDRTSGEVVYTITGDDAETLLEVTALLESSDISDTLSTEFVVVVSVDAPTEVVASVDVSVDASGVADIDTALSDVAVAIESMDDAYVVETSGKTPVSKI